MANITDQDIAAIKSLREPWIQAMMDREWDRLFTICTPNITFFPPEAPIAEGTEEARAYLDEFPVMTSFDFEFTRIDGRDDLATARGNFHITAEADGQDVTMDGKFIDTFRKADDGNWRFEEVIWSTDHPMS